MTSSQFLAIVRAKILEATTEIVTDETLFIYANFTIQDIIKRAFPNGQIKTATVSLSSGSGSLPADFGTLYGDAYDANNNFYPEISIDDFNKDMLVNCVTVEGGVLKVKPTTVTSVSIKYYPNYTAMSAVVNPSIDSYFHELIIYGTLTRVFEDLQDESLSQFYGTKYENMLNQRIAIQSNYEEGNQRGGQMFNGIDILGGGLSDSPNKF